ncbi:HD domain-containing phosphohydrolase [Maridesulfovibrio bastinii]|uniref:HD domain-containing phosphohydrolase n=1 Tax=Maridesulfovibrio bastinii TaxID=47157 RepID=UPI0004013540|nr:HD domain-containing phosphohydrolase [Maridesulfovibrio bastinii]
MIASNIFKSEENKRNNILIVEDEAIVSLDIKGRLSVLGYTVLDIVKTGELAVERTLELEPDLVLMDIMLDGEMDGIDAATEILKKADIPIIYLTAYADEKTLERAKVTEPFGYIIKPFEDRELNLAIEMALYKHHAESTLNENRRWLKTAFNSIGDTIITLGKDGRIRSVNKAAEQLFQFEITDLCGEEFSSSIKFADNEGNPVDVLQLFEQQGTESTIFNRLQLVSIKGDNIPVSLNIASINDKNKKKGTVIVLHDMSAIIQGEAALQKSLDQLRLAFDETVTSLSLMSEKRDPYTSGHQQRVAKIACAIAKRMNLPEKTIQGISVAGVLHDVGKIYIPAEILSKPTRLTGIELSLVKTHPEVGYDILKGIPFPWPVADIVLQHHERLDGSGYPKGLSAAEILPEARIISVADVVEAMSSHRPYRAALGLDKALGEIIRGRGTIYDAEIVDVCIKLFEEDGFTIE